MKAIIVVAVGFAMLLFASCKGKTDKEDSSLQGLQRKSDIVKYRIYRHE